MNLRASRLILATVFLVLTISGCARAPVSSETSHSVVNPERVVDVLYRQHEQWKGAPYQYGGMSRRGVDCSGLAYLTFRDQLGITIPRTTAQQSRLGQPVSRNQLEPGDLVFFKTGDKLRHVGIYIEDEKFLHVSTKKGVMISRLGDYYWKDRYRYARRVR